MKCLDANRRFCNGSYPYIKDSKMRRSLYTITPERDQYCLILFNNVQHGECKEHVIGNVHDLCDSDSNFRYYKLQSIINM